MADTLRYLLVGSGEISLENIEVITISIVAGCVWTMTLHVALLGMTPLFKLGDHTVIASYSAALYAWYSILQLMSRSPSEVYEILSVAR